MKFLRVLLAFAILTLPAIALAAPTITVIEKTVFGNKRVVRALVTFDSSYPTGGESVTAANLQMQSIEMMIVAPRSGYVFDYNYDASKVLAYCIPDTTTGDFTAFQSLAQVANATDLSGLDSVRVLAIGK